METIKTSISKDNSEDFLPLINIIRAVAITLVVSSHISNIKFLEVGFIGVDIFFTISGFLICRTLIRNKNINFKTFFKKRIKKLIPSYLILIIISSLIGLIILAPNYINDYKKSYLASLFSFLNFYLMGKSNYFDIRSSLRPLLHLWSLSVEFQFYIFLPFLIFLTIFREKYKLQLTSKNLYNLKKIFIAISILSLSGTFFTDNYNSFYYFSPLRLFEFLIGSIIAIDEIERPKYFSFLTKTKIIYPLILIFLPYIIFFNIQDINWPSIYTLFTSIGTGLLIYKSFNNSQINNRILYFSNIISKLSYSIYLVHWPIIVYYDFILSIFNINNSLIFTSIILLTIFIASYYLYKYVELNSKIFLKKNIFSLLVFLIIIIFISFDIKNYLFKKIDFNGYYSYIDNLNLSNKEQSLLNKEIADFNINQTNKIKESTIFIIGDSQANDIKDSLILSNTNSFKIKSFYFDDTCIESFNIKNNERNIKNNKFANYFMDFFIKRDINFTECRGRTTEFLKLIKTISKNDYVIIVNDLQTANNKKIKKGLKEIIRKTSLKSNQIIFAGPLPHLNGLNNTLYFTKKNPSFLNNSVTASKAITNRRFVFLENFYSKMSKSLNIKYLSRKELICTNNKCLFQDPNSNLIFYRDYRHLNKKGIYFFSKKLSDMIETLIKTT